MCPILSFRVDERWTKAYRVDTDYAIAKQLYSRHLSNRRPCLRFKRYIALVDSFCRAALTSISAASSPTVEIFPPLLVVPIPPPPVLVPASQAPKPELIQRLNYCVAGKIVQVEREANRKASGQV